MKPIRQINRREMLASGAAVAAVTIVPRHVLGGPKFKPPSEKLNIAGVGIGGMGSGDIRNCAGENIVALCDVDQRAVARVHRPGSLRRAEYPLRRPRARHGRHSQRRWLRRHLPA